MAQSPFFFLRALFAMICAASLLDKESVTSRKVSSKIKFGLLKRTFETSSMCEIVVFLTSLGFYAFFNV